MYNRVSSSVKKRVAIFHAGIPVMSQTANCAIALTQAGYEVDLFLFDTGTFVDLKKLGDTAGIQIHDLQIPVRALGEEVADWIDAVRTKVKHFLGRASPGLLRLYRVMRSTARDLLFSLLGHAPVSEFIRRGTVKRSLRLMKDKQYQCLIGVEKHGLIWAAEVARQRNAAVIYYSLELYTEDFGRVVMSGSKVFERLRSIERLYHRRAVATIVQDPDRAQALFEANGLRLSDSTVLYVPVSLLGGRYEKRSAYLREKFQLSSEQKVILYFGQIYDARRLTLQLARVAKSFPDDWVLVLHGPDYGSTVEKIEALECRDKVIVSREFVPSDKIQDVVASADVGLAFYSDTIQNDRLTAFASEKMALYMQCGVPFVAFDYPGFRRLATESQCGVVVRRLPELPTAIEKILCARDDFRCRAWNAFEEHYDFQQNFAPVIDHIESLPVFEPLAEGKRPLIPATMD